ncbi:MAG: hypothetical protein ACXAB7_16675 [Candidatus Kariarchaeaceae archaeon]|jgi:Zn ribbon nucleic-acid-binding protein
MPPTVDLWVCPNCNELQGIEVYREGDQQNLQSFCVKCGISLPLNTIGFIDATLARTLINEVEKLISPDIWGEIRYSWVSHRTVGIIFELPRESVIEYSNMDIVERIEDELGEQMELMITVYFE